MNTPSTPDALVMYGQSFASRLLLGTARYPSPTVLQAAVQRAKPAMVTASLRRQGSNPAESGHGFWDLLRSLNVPVLPNTAGCHSVQDAITTAQMAREVFNTPWIKLEVIGDDYTLQPDTLNLVAAAENLIRDGFYVLPTLAPCSRSTPRSPAPRYWVRRFGTTTNRRDTLCRPKPKP